MDDDDDSGKLDGNYNDESDVHDTVADPGVRVLNGCVFA